MSDPRIAQLRAKAASTTFPAEAAALRAKADELEAKQPKGPPIRGQSVTYEWVDELVDFRQGASLAADLMARMAEAMRKAEEAQRAARPAAATFRFSYDPSDPDSRTDWTGITFQKVTDINGNTYWTRID